MLFRSDNVILDGPATVQGYIEIGGLEGLGGDERLYIGGDPMSMRVGPAGLDGGGSGPRETLESQYDDVGVFGRKKVFQSEPGPDGTVYVEEGEDIATMADKESYIQALRDQLQTLGDDSQLANADLQNILQKQQATLQLMSNVSKVLHDTAMTIIRKIGS